MGIDEDDDDTEFNKDIARQYAREKQLKLVELRLDNQAKVEEAFMTVVQKIMDTWQAQSGAAVGKVIVGGGRECGGGGS